MARLDGEPRLGAEEIGDEFGGASPVFVQQASHNAGQNDQKLHARPVIHELLVWGFVTLDTKETG